MSGLNPKDRWNLDDAVQTLAILRQKGLTPGMTKWIRQNDGENAQAMVEWLSDRKAGLPERSVISPPGAIVIPAVHPSKETLVMAYQSQFADFWRSPEDQVKTMEQIAYRSDVPACRELRSAWENGCPNPPTQQLSPFQVRVLCFGAEELTSTISLALAMIERHRMPIDAVRPDRMAARTSLAAGKFHKKGLYWEVLDVESAYPREELEEVPHRLAGVEALFALATHNRWCTAMQQGEMPRIVIGGLRYRTEDGGKHVFVIDNSASPGSLRLQHYPVDEHYGVRERAVPILML